MTSPANCRERGRSVGPFGLAVFLISLAAVTVVAAVSPAPPAASPALRAFAPGDALRLELTVDSHGGLTGRVLDRGPDALGGTAVNT